MVALVASNNKFLWGCMENIGNKKRLSKWLCAWLCSLAVLSGSFCFADKDEPTPGELLRKSGQLLNAKKYDEAIETMYVYLEMVDATTAQGVLRVSQELRFRLITILIERGQLDEAIPVLQDYIKRPMGEYPRLVRKLLATCLYESEDYAGSVVAANNALRYNEDPSSLAGRPTLTPDEAERFAKYDELAKLQQRDTELEFSDEEVTGLHMTIAEAHYKLGKWDECIAPYEYVAENTGNSQRKGYAIMQMIDAMVAMPDFDRIAAWIPELYRTPARYDIRVNLALLRVAAALFDRGMFDEALPLYRMIPPRDELISYQEARLRELRISKGLPPEDNMEVSEGEALLFGVADERVAAETEEDAETGNVTEKPKEVVDLENLILAVKNLPPYETDIKYRMAQIYEKVGRYWEAVKFLDIVYRLDPDNEMGEFAAYKIVQILLRELDALDNAERFGFEYLDRQKKGLTPRQVAYLFTGYHQKRDEMEAIKALRPWLDGFVRADADPDVVADPKVYENVKKHDAELYYMQAVADLVLFKFDESETGFKLVLDEFPGSHQEGNSLYWYGMSKLFLQKYAEAYDIFEAYGRRFAHEEWIDEASYQSGVCLFGLEDYDAASNRFSHVIATYPGENEDDPDFSTVFPEACNMRGDIYGSVGELESAETDYRNAIARAKKVPQATYAVFQLVAIFKATDKYDDIITLVEAYRDQWTVEADIAKALFWIGKSKLQKGVVADGSRQENLYVDEVIDDYLAAIMEYGTDVKQDGVDMMIDELVSIANLWLDFDKQEALLAELQAAVDTTEDLVLKLRLRVTMAMITKTESELGRTLLAELEDFESVSPPVLAVICKVSLEMEDYSRAEELLDIFKTNFEDSDYIRAAFKLRSFGQSAEKDYDGALVTVDEARGIFGNEPDMAWAQLMKAQLLLEKGLFDEAITNNLIVIGEPAWRGVPAVQATYQLGQVEEGKALASQGEERDQFLARAFAYYQRVYFQYKGFADGHWAAEAYLSSARCLELLGQEEDRLNTFRAMLFDSYVNTLPQADVAREELGAAESAEIEALLEAGVATNIAIAVETAEPEAGTDTVEIGTPDTEPTVTGGGE